MSSSGYPEACGEFESLESLGRDWTLREREPLEEVGFHLTALSMPNQILLGSHLRMAIESFLLLTQFTSWYEKFTIQNSTEASS